MLQETRLEIVLAAVRWANNILVEVLSNHARVVNKSGADALRRAVSALAEADQEFRGLNKPKDKPKDKP